MFGGVGGVRSRIRYGQNGRRSVSLCSSAEANPVGPPGCQRGWTLNYMLTQLSFAIARLCLSSVFWQVRVVIA